MTAPARLPQAEYKRIFAAAKQAGVLVSILPDGTVAMVNGVGASGNDNAPVVLD